MVEFKRLAANTGFAIGLMTTAWLASYFIATALKEYNQSKKQTTPGYFEYIRD